MLIAMQLFSCAKAVPVVPGVPDEAFPAETAAHMNAHFSLASEARRAVIRGDLGGTQAAAQELVDLEPLDGLPDQWRPWVADMKGVSALVVDSSNLDEAASAVSALGLSCAGCHTATGGGPRLDVSSVPEQDWEGRFHMARHKWASDWMWLGLLGPNDAAWERGTGILAEGPLLDLEFRAPQTDEFANLEVYVHQLAIEGRAATEPERRSEVYGRFMAACAHCHAASGGERLE